MVNYLLECIKFIKKGNPVYVLGNILLGLASVLSSVLFVLMIAVIASAVISWVNADPYNQIVRIIRSITEPLYKVIRKKIPTTFGALDLTPIIVLLIIQFSQIAIVDSIRMFATNLTLGQ